MAAVIGIVAVPLALLMVAGLLGLLRRVGIDLGSAPGVLLLLGLPVGLLAVSMALDGSGDVRTGQVIDKSEVVRVKPEGDWSDDLKLSVRFANDPTTTLPVVRSTGAAVGEVIGAAGALSTGSMRVDSRHFDRVQIGDPFDLKVLPLRNGLSVVRPADTSTRLLLPAGTLEWGIGVAAVLFLGWRLRRRPPGVAILVGLALLAAVYPLYHADQLWREREDLTGAAQRASATVTNTTRVTQINLLPNDVRDDAGVNRHDVPQPYDIVEVQLQAAGYPAPVTAVDAIDATSTSGVVRGQVVPVVYAPDDPHGARLDGQTRTQYWRTTVGVYTDLAVYLAAVVLLVLAIGFIGRQMGRRKTTTHP